MTQEEKAKAYDEALDYEKMYKAVLKTAKQWIEDGCSDKEKICLESIFPELRESEDERIRKEIIDFLVKERKGRWAQWLERQKECVADSSKTSVDEDESIRKFLVDYFTSYKIGNVATKLNGVRIDDILNYLEKQKEQKHPNGCFTCDEYKKGYEEGRRNGFTAGYNKAMKEVEQKEQKPVVTHGETYHVDTLGTQQVIAGKMPQKPVQSEEEKEYVRTLKGLVSDFIRNSGGGITDVSYYQRIYDWLDGRHIEQKPVEYLSKDKVYAIMNKLTELSTSELIPLNSDEYKKINEITSDIRSLLDYPIEQKPNIELIQKSWYMEGYHDKEFNCDPKWIIKTGEGGPRYEENPKYRQIIEQKPAKWDDYTKTNLGRAIQIIKDARGTLHGYQTDDGIYECDKAIEALEHFLYRGLEIEKSAEWSEEDEEMIMNIISSLHGYICTFGPDPKNHEAHIQKEINWLKSLRPVSKESLQSHWKPSEAQLMALHSMIDDESDTIGNEQLKLLYEQLKKLM